MTTTLGHVHLMVRDADRSAGFYKEVFGLQENERLGNFIFLGTEKIHHVVALQGLGADAQVPPNHTVGLFHTAFEVQDEVEFARFWEKLQAMGIANSAVDYGISWAVYFQDPDGIGLEVYTDRRHALAEPIEWQGGTRRLTKAELEPLLV